jgi:hypothetical protein
MCGDMDDLKLGQRLSLESCFGGVGRQQELLFSERLPRRDYLVASGSAERILPIQL